MGDLNNTYLIAYATTPYQILIGSYIVIELKKYMHNIKVQLVYDKYLNTSLKYFDMDMWDDYIEFNVNNHCVDWHCYSVFKGDDSFYKNNLDLVNALKDIDNRLYIPNIILFSSGNSIVPYHLMKRNRTALSIMFSDGIASYKKDLNQEMKSRIARDQKLVFKCIIFFIRKLYYLLFKYEFPIPSDLLICGNQYVNIYMDFHIDLAQAVFKGNRINYELSIGMIKNEINKLINEQYNAIAINKKRNKKTMLFFSQCFAEDYNYPLEWDVEYINRINVFCIKNGYDLVIKPHPRESEEKIKKIKKICCVEEHLKMIPFEILCMKNDFYCLATVSSTSIMNAYYLNASQKYIVFEEDFIKWLKLMKKYQNKALSISEAFCDFYDDEFFIKGFTV